MKKFFKDLWQFIKSKRFLIHFGIYLVSIFIILRLVFWWLDITTGHGEFVEVPDFTTVKIADVKDFATNFGLRDTIIDSVYDAKKAPGVVVAQDPEPKTKVKHNRTIYLYVTSFKPQSVSMPNLVDASPRQAVQMLESYGLKPGPQRLKPGLKCVLAQLYKGQPIDSGTVIPKGSVIELWIGKGEGEGDPVGVPCIKGMTREEANIELAKGELVEGAVICIDCKTSKDSVSARVYRQIPSCEGEHNVSSGSSVDIYLTLDAAKLPKE